ncbi:hypothetical protein E3T37_11390 [Cryobacterium sp. TMT2-10]|uniref:Uncharacterized protein n=1 Tax=Cryobacterium shii TaxID=1259235 RepID=A0AAQ2C7D4_9MICO|nr:hypothetical protein E3O49_05805 [Cryobacterium shii]TFC84033.1 hypothetical protein E3T24_10935 [Cryobacterium sp. TmT2-59]TFD16140.1 hypothetical protein E3T42_09665 [Cryobacterium sp. TMT4-10]TFD18472.1 hypothetical protein E3T32_12240 [Cryobacterium sp. TMT2-23]TFD37664.1 hypothetical protein E3T37_11390 [Cryobacterium sp. TMT2-10]
MCARRGAGSPLSPRPARSIRPAQPSCRRRRRNPPRGRASAAAGNPGRRPRCAVPGRPWR